MKVVVLYNEPIVEGAVDDQDVLVQRDSVAAALERLGMATFCLGCTLNLDRAWRQLQELQPEVVFNLVESLGGTDRLMPLATLMLDTLAIEYTGASTNAILATSNKLAAKQHLFDAGLPTPAWIVRFPGSKGAIVHEKDTESAPTGPWIVKPVWEHASLGMDDDAVLAAGDRAAIEARIRFCEQHVHRPHFSEQYIDGREFNLSILAGQLLPPAEIDFSTFPPEKPRIVGHRAKWEPSSFEYQQTPRRFDFPKEDAQLLEQLAQLALDCWRLFELRGYARVDIRVDQTGQPWILEVNVNPCLSPDAGFAAALEEAGISYDTAVQKIIDEANRDAIQHPQP